MRSKGQGLRGTCPGGKTLTYVNQVHRSMPVANLREHIVQMQGPGVLPGLVSPRAHRFASKWVEESTRRSARMRVFAVSREVGRPKAALEHLAALYEGGITKEVPGGLG